jgi:hypothetical protein
MHHEEVELDTKVEEEEEEALEEAKNQWYATTVNKQGIMKDNFHFHLRCVCIVTHQIMKQKNVLHYWGRSRKREKKKCLVDFDGSKG